MSQLRRFDQIIGGTTGEANEIAYDNSTSGLSANNVQGAIDEVNSDLSELTAHSFGSQVNISSYTASTPYTFPSDGYVTIGASAVGYVTLRFNGAQKRVINDKTNPNIADLIYVKKGMLFYVQDNSANATAFFNPLV